MRPFANTTPVQIDSLLRASIGVLHAYVPLLSGGGKSSAAHYENLLLALAAAPVPLRPIRSESRTVKRRPKSY